MAVIYLSSTYADLVEERSAVYRALRQLRHDVLSMEDYGAADERPVDKCLADVRSCDVYVGVFAWRYGYVPPGEQRSITELELREAERSDKPRLLFLLSEDAPWPRNRMDPDLDAIERLRAEIGRDRTVAFFTNADDLARAVGIAVTNTLGTVGEPGHEQDASKLAFYRDCMRRTTAELGTQIRVCMISTGALLALGTGLLFAGLLALENQAVGVGGTLLGATTVFPLAMMLTTRRKKVVLEGYERALMQDPPAREVVAAVGRFLNRQLED